MTMRINLHTDAAAITSRLRSFPPRMEAALVREMDRQNELTTGYVQKTRLSARGPTTLGVVTNRLRKSLRPSRTIATGTELISSIGSNVAYLGPHEFGYRGPQFVRSYYRQVKSRNVRGTIDGKRKRVATGVALVKAHTREVDIPERAPLRRGIEERVPVYSRELSRVIVQEWSARG
jgi:hypothetical protein